MTDSQTGQQRPVHDHSFLTSLCTHIFSADYLYFAPAILVSLFWHLLPIPKVATVCLFLWSLPLFTAGAATALHVGPESLFNRIHSRCPIQGVFILVYALAALAGFFIVLLFADSLGWIGCAWGEILTALLMGAGIVASMIRIWPDYLLRVIHPKYGPGDSWLGVDFPHGLGPTFLTAWKYSARAKLPASTVVSALVSLFVVAGGVLFLHADLFPGHRNFRFIGGVFVLGLFYPVAHLVLISAGARLLSANGIHPVAVAERNSRPSVSPLPASEVRYRTQVFDRDAPIDERVFACVNQNDVEIITGWLIQNNNRKDNMVALYDRNRNIIQIIGGPWKSGHWGHDSYGTDVRLEDALIGIYPRGFSIEDKYVEIIKQYILRNGLK